MPDCQRHINATILFLMKAFCELMEAVGEALEKRPEFTAEVMSDEGDI